jgi:phosphate transport system permease protein
MFWANGLDQPISTMPVQIYTYAITPFPDWHAKAWAGALVLIVLILILNIGVRFVTKRKYGV